MSTIGSLLVAVNAVRASCGPGESAVNKVDSESTDGLVEETDSGQAMPVNDLIASVASTAKEMCRVSNGVT